MRLLLEPRAAALAAANAGEPELDLMEDLAEGMRERPGPGERYAVYREFAAADQRFHDALALASGRPLLADAMRRLHSHLHLFRLGTVPGAGALTVAEHDRVLRAVLRGKPERASAAMTEHLRLSLERQRERERGHRQVR